MIRFGGIEISTNSIASGERERRQVSSVENVVFFDFRIVEKDWERDGIEESHYFGVVGDERAGGHVCSNNGRVVFFDSASEELGSALVIEVVEAVGNRAEDREAIAAGDRLQWKLWLRGR